MTKKLIVGIALNYMNNAEKNSYISNKFPDDKSGADILLQQSVSENIPVSSIYIELRNSDGSYIASYQTK